MLPLNILRYGLKVCYIMILIFETSPSNAVATGGPLQGIPPRAARVALLFLVQKAVYNMRNIKKSIYNIHVIHIHLILAGISYPCTFSIFFQICTFIDFHSLTKVLNFLTHALICHQWKRSVGVKSNHAAWCL